MSLFAVLTLQSRRGSVSNSILKRGRQQQEKQNGKKLIESDEKYQLMEQVLVFFTQEPNIYSCIELSMLCYSLSCHHNRIYIRTRFYIKLNALTIDLILFLIFQCSKVKYNSRSHDNVSASVVCRHFALYTSSSDTLADATSCIAGLLDTYCFKHTRARQRRYQRI